MKSCNDCKSVEGDLLCGFPLPEGIGGWIEDRRIWDPSIAKDCAHFHDRNEPEKCVWSDPSNLTSTSIHPGTFIAGCNGEHATSIPGKNCPHCKREIEVKS